MDLNAQALAALALTSTVWGDGAIATACLLVASGRLGFAPAVAAVTSGTAIGDFAAYGAGRLGLPWARTRAGRPSLAGLGRRCVVAIIAARVVPGIRIPACVGAGLLHVPVRAFALAAVGSSLGWTSILLLGATALAA